MLIASLYLLPNLLVGVCINLSVGIFIDRLPAGWLIVGSALFGALAPLTMALVSSFRLRNAFHSQGVNAPGNETFLEEHC
jgi:hypothetical protein